MYFDWHCLGYPVTLLTLNIKQDFKSESIELFGALQKHSKIIKIEKNNFEILKNLFLQNILVEKENNVKIRQSERI